ncbi:hypothetical protein FBY06_14045 [Pseudomonas sp. SJZ085]|uniref:hypothetical protein n=1 Tax=unclassified Pseudomonas TaxID=196821 RepID=UPI00119C43E2|nr:MULTISPECIES: hypothetical protein [unclassified Pseudomonas]TWC12041.1 hypothetical protein FBX99_13945 [Pseudomonas sp. SJZ074]TWC30622.1 hypothetical protein FBY06_14045 [Pseudomonas sp. SJZ085]
MPAKKTTPVAPAPLVSVKPPARRSSGKGEPPATASDTAAMGNHTAKPSSGDIVDFNMKVPAEFKAEVDIYLATHRITRKAYVMDLIERDMKAKGWTPQNQG